MKSNKQTNGPYMTDSKRTNSDGSRRYAAPTITDYGDLVELTAAGATGGHVDATFTNGQQAFFLSTPPVGG